MIARLKIALITLSDKPKYQYALLVVITLLAALLRFYRLGAWSFWIDELFTLGRLRFLGDIFQNPRVLLEIRPPPSILLMSVAAQFLETTEWNARLVPALVGIASIPILFFPIRRMFDPVVALLASLLLAVSPWHLFWSQNARSYTMLLLIYTLALFTIYFALERDKPRYIILFFLLAGIAARERFMAGFLGPVVVSYLFMLWALRFEKPAGWRWRNVALILLPGILLVAVDAIRYALTRYSFFIASMELSYNKPVEDPLRMASFILFELGIPLAVMGGFGGLYLVAQRSRAGLLFLISAVLPVLLLLLANPFIFTQPRYVFVTLTSWIILAATAVAGLFTETRNNGKILAVGVLMLFLVDAAGAHLLYYHVNHGNRRDWKSAFAIVNENLQDEDEVVAWWTEFGPYYLGGRKITSWGDVKPEMVLQSGQRFWFVLDSETVWGNQEMKLWVENNAELIEVFYLRTPDDNDLHIYLYDPARGK
ncbi:MAG TPA: glycosyltransferase family 39 protein [Chloroflexota bacterium]|nr:glycosyltransferase family 39 protein [Chloroflexota bacterium]HUM69944.1 glycosyltransferase family 39 protein [Chloroflexota bacterium]